MPFRAGLLADGDDDGPLQCGPERIRGTRIVSLHI